MLQFRFSSAGVAAVRLGYSPLTELTLRLHALPAEHPTVRSAQRTGGRGTQLFLQLAGVPCRGPEEPAVALPDLVTPPPGPASHPRLESELAAFASTSPRTVARDLETAFGRDVPSDLRCLYGPASGTARASVARAAHAIWTHESTHWRAVRSSLEREIADHTREVATGGVGRLFRGIDGAAWDGETLAFDRPHLARRVTVDRHGLVVALTAARLRRPSFGLDGAVPAIFLRQRARGAVVVDRHRALGQLLGPVRADVLARLVTPSTTANLAVQVGRDPATVSRHLSVLHDAGLVDRRRHGRRVLYGVTGLGRAVLRGEAAGD